MNDLSTLPGWPPGAHSRMNTVVGMPDDLDAQSYLLQLEADCVAWELSFRTDLEGVPAPVQDFIFGPWARVLAQVRLADGPDSPRWQRYAQRVEDLVWSTQQDLTLRSPQRLIATVPVLLADLREGLALIEQPAGAQEQFFRRLMRLHTPVLRLRAARSRRGQA